KIKVNKLQSYIVLNDDCIKNNLIGMNQNNTSMMHLWPFTKQQMQSRNKKIGDNNDWTLNKYEEILNNYPNFQKMAEEPFLLQLILTMLPSLVKQYGLESGISKVQASLFYSCFTIHILSLSSSALLKFQFLFYTLTLKRGSFGAFDLNIKIQKIFYNEYNLMKDKQKQTKIEANTCNQMYQLGIVSLHFILLAGTATTTFQYSINMCCIR
ncbi:hypothetical protein RFI_38167, partial [Reticulomyxa filosa]